MAQINFTIPDAKLQRIVDAMKGLYPIPWIPDPQDPETEIPEFTDNQWAKEALRRLVVRSVSRWETKVAKDAAAVSLDDGIIT